MGYVLEGRVSIPRRVRYFSLLHNVQTGSGAHPASYKIVIQNYFAGDKNGRGMKFNSRHEVPRSIMVELYRHSPTHLHGMVLN
jgi:hypothetical protein